MAVRPQQKAVFREFWIKLSAAFPISGKGKIMPLFCHAALAAVLEFIDARTHGAYLVGGAVRDCLMGRQFCSDLDIAVIGDGRAAAQEAAKALGLTFVSLDKEHGTGRIVIKDVHAFVDVSTLKGNTIQADLLNRDFTVNALAVPVADFLKEGCVKVIDVTGGMRDLDGRTVRMCSPSSYENDPLRIMRAFRFVASLGFDLERVTADMIPAYVTRLREISPERIRDEFMCVLAAQESYKALKLMDQYGVMSELFPELDPMRGCGQNSFHHLDVWDHTLEAIRMADLLLHDDGHTFRQFNPEIRDYLAVELVPGRPRRSLVKFACLFHDAGKPACKFVDEQGRIRFFGHEKLSGQMVEDAAERLKLAKKEIRFIRRLVEYHMRAMVFTADSLSKRALNKLMREMEDDLAALFVLFLADLRATRGPARRPGNEEHALGNVLLALENFFDGAAAKTVPLVNGKVLMERFGLKSGPIIGHVLRKLTQFQDSGKIHDAEEALSAAEKILAEKQL